MRTKPGFLLVAMLLLTACTGEVVLPESPAGTLPPRPTWAPVEDPDRLDEDNWTPGAPIDDVLVFDGQVEWQLLRYAETVGDAWFHPELDCYTWWEGVSGYVSPNWAVTLANWCAGKNPERVMAQIYDSTRIGPAVLLDQVDGTLARVLITGANYTYRATFTRTRIQDPWLMTFFTRVSKTGS